MKNVTYINAGAGSGKTFKLTQILSEKLAKQDRNGNSVIKPSQVILTTFTELAASEFREKARQKLLEAGNLDAAAQMDSAAIGTVHSIALRFIKKFWYLLGYGAEIQTITERDEDFYMSQSLARIVTLGDNSGYMKTQNELGIFRKFRDYYDISDGYSHPDYLFWQRHLRDIVEKMEYYDVNDVTESIKKSLETVRAIYVGPPVDYDFIAKALEEYRDFCKTKTGNPAETGDKVGTRLLTEKRDRRWLADVYTLLKDPCKRQTAEKECSRLIAAQAMLKESSISQSDLEIMEPYIKAIFTLAKEWRDDYIAYKKRNHIISYNDMERLFYHLISNEQEVQDYIRENYRLVMVDEFQDSNPIQLKIFNRLSELIACAGGHSVWVGDPKQAIYGFRGADTELVNSVSTHFTFFDDAEIHPEEGPNNLGSGRLVESWRSRPTLVNLVNAVFADKFKGDIDPLCITLSPHFKNDVLNSNAIVHWHKLKNHWAETRIKPDALAWRVKKFLDSKMLVHHGKLDEDPAPIRPKDVAILCRKNETIKDVVKAMRKYDIPVSESEDAIMQRIEVQLVVTLLQFVQNPNNKHVIADLIRLLWGSTTESILRDRIDYVLANVQENNDKFDASKDEWNEHLPGVEELRDLADRFKHMSVPEIVRGLIYECNLPALVAKWGDNIIRKQNLSTVQHLADDYDQMCLQMGLGSSISGFIYYLNSIEPDRERDNQSNTVKVFTYHGSKGLEWPVVILNELKEDVLDSGTLIKKQFMRVREMVLQDNASSNDPFAKEYYLHFFPNIVKGANGKPADPMIDKIKELEFFKQLEKRIKGEEIRLLYVGMTRAKDCIISLGIEDDVNNDFAWLKNVGIKTPDNKHIWGVAQFDNSVEEINVPDSGVTATVIPKYTIVNKPQAHSDYGERYLSPSKLEDYPGLNTHTQWQEHGIEIDTKGWGKDYATIGSCIHDIFAAYQKGKDEANRQIALNIIGGYGVADQLSGHIAAILRSADWLYDTLQSKFPQRDGDKIECEVPFMMTLNDGRALRGEMDMLWHYTDDQGQHCILVDYKSFQGVDLNSHTKSYYPQLSAYVEALKECGIDVTHSIIFYPVYSIVHELT